MENSPTEPPISQPIVVGEPPVAPPAPQAPPTPPVATPQPQAIMVTPCEVFSNSMTIGGARGDLVWTAADTVMLRSVDEKGTTVLFECAPNEIERFAYYPNFTKIKLRDGRMFKIGLTVGYTKALYRSLLNNAPGALGAYSFFRGGWRSDVKVFTGDQHNYSKWWVTSLRAYGVRTRRWTMLRYTLWIVLGIPLFIVAVVFIYAAISVFSA